MFDTEFTQGAGCGIVAPRGTPVTSTTVIAFFDSNSLSTNSALVTSIYVQTGSTQNTYPWSVTLLVASWSGTVWTYSNSQVLIN